MKFHDGTRVAIIGGGPAGSYFALYLLKYARELGISPEIDIYEKKIFAKGGPAGCNQCAGVLSYDLLHNMTELELELPDSIIQSRITAYRLHSPYGIMDIPNLGTKGELISVFRGGGPAKITPGKDISFDGFLLEKAQNRGARIIHKNVNSIELSLHPSVTIGNERLPYDLIVLAAGVSAKKIHITGSTYEPPKTQTMVQAEIHLGSEAVDNIMGTLGHVFLFPNSPLIFGSLVPKGECINVSLLGTKGYVPNLKEFLDNNQVKSFLPCDYKLVCGCKPKINVGSARNPYTDGFVSIGDAYVSRIYKDGIGSALRTARCAAYTTAYNGFSREAFSENYGYMTRDISRDNRWGRLIFDIHNKTKNSKIFFIAHAKLVTSEWSKPPERRTFNQAAWGMFTGAHNYARILAKTLNPIQLVLLGWSMLLRTIQLLLRRPERNFASEEQPLKKNILILGSGFGGLYTALGLQRKLKRDNDHVLVMVSNENFFLFTPFLHNVACGTVETRHIAFPIRRLRRRNPRVLFHQREILAIDLQKKQVETDGGSIEYDYLVIALGSITDSRQLPSYESNVFELKTLFDGLVIRNHMIHMFEQADVEHRVEEQNRFLTFVVAGGGYTGVQLISEIEDFIRGSLLKRYRSINPALIKIILVEEGPRIMGEMHEKLSDTALAYLKSQGIEALLNSRVTRVSAKDIEINGKRTISTGTIIWATGVISNPITAKLPLEKDEQVRIKVNEYLQVFGYTNVYALGDNACFINNQTGIPLPPRAHFAVREAKIVAKNIFADITGKPVKAYKSGSNPAIVSLGSWTAIADIYGLHLHGIVARFLWMISYLMLMKGILNRTRVAVDWALNIIFGRDITLLKIDKQGPGASRDNKK